METFNPLDAKETAALKERFKTVTALRAVRSKALSDAETSIKAAMEKLTAAREDSMLAESEYEILKKRIELYGLEEKESVVEAVPIPVKPFEHEA